MTGKFPFRFRCQCHGGENGVSYDGLVCLFRWSHAQYVLALQSNLDILLGVGVSGLIINLSSAPGSAYEVSISPTLLVSTISLFLVLSSMLIVVPLCKWRMTRTFGICLVVFFSLSTATSVLVEIFL